MRYSVQLFCFLQGCKLEQTAVENNFDYSNARRILECLLFISKKPLSAADIKTVTGIDEALIDDLADDISKKYEESGLQIIRLAKGYLMATKPQYGEYVEKLINAPISFSLSKQSLETLAIIAYKQPVTKLEIENIRGVMSDGVIKTLQDKRLIKESGRSDSVGRPILYSTTVDFLKHFGLHDLDELPSLESLEGAQPVLEELEKGASFSIQSGQETAL